MSKPLILFLGTAEFGGPSLQALVKEGYRVIIITKPDAPAGRGHKLHSSAIKKLGLELGLEVFEPLNQKAILKIIDQFKPSLGLVVAYGKIFKTDILTRFSQGVLNLHPSLLPKYRGPSPIQTCLKNGDSETGTSLMLLDDQVDHGPILAQAKYQIKPEDDAGSLHDALAKLSADLLIDKLPIFIEAKLKPLEQNHDLATFTEKLEKNQTAINLNSTVFETYNFIRSLSPWPGAWINHNNKRLKILKTSLTNTTNSLALTLADGQIYCLVVQPENSRVMSAQEYLNGLNQTTPKVTINHV